jgi:hypothetical protein
MVTILLLPVFLTAPQEPFSQASIWDDGQAEVSVYDGEEMLAGAKRAFVAYSVVVAESLDSKTLVKVETAGADQRPVLKYNLILDIPTGISSAKQMASLFFCRETMAPLKASFSSQDWCGNVFQLWRHDREQLEVRSYQSSEGDRTYPLTLEQAEPVFYDSLPLWLRSRSPHHERNWTIQLVRRRLTSSAPEPQVVTAHLVFQGIRQGQNNEGRALVELHDGEAVDRFFFDPSAPHSLLEWVRADGTRYRLRNVQRLPYWKHTSAADRKLLLGEN